MELGGHDALHTRYRAHSPSEEFSHRKKRPPARTESPATKKTKLDQGVKSLASDLFSIHPVLDKDELQYLANKAQVEVKCVQDYNDALTETVRLMYKTPKLVGLSAIGDWDQASTRGQFTWWDKESVEKMEEPEKDVDELVMESIRRQFELLQRLHPLRDNLGKGIKDAASVNVVADICLKAPKSIVYRLLLVRFLSNTTEPSACESLRRDKKTAEELFSWCCGAAMDKDTTLLAEGLAVIHSFDYFPRLLYADWQRRLVEDWRDHIDFRVRRAAEDNLWKKT